MPSRQQNDSDAAGTLDSPSALKPIRTILGQEIQQAEDELDRPLHGIFVSGVLAGLGVGVSTLAVAIVLTLAAGELPHSLTTIIAANAYTIGFIVVILAQTDLFTEYTTIAILPVLTGRASIASLARLWGLVYAGNLVGAGLMALLIATLGPELEIIRPATLSRLASRLVEHPWWVILLSAILAGWLMGLLSWLIVAGKDTTSQILFIWLISAVIGLGHLHHAITGGLDVAASILSGASHSAGDLGYMLFWTTVGNAIGGVVFAVLIRYSLTMGEGADQQDRRSESHDRGSRRQT